MNISGLTNIQPTQNYSMSVKKHSYFNKNLKTDTFERTTSPAFAGRSSKCVKLIENELRNIDGVHDPYSDIVMISERKFNAFRTKLKKRNNSKSMITLLSAQEEHMFPPEKEVFGYIKSYTKKTAKNSSKKARELTFSEILQDLLPNAKVHLVNKQVNVIKNIQKLSEKQLSEESQKKVNQVLSTIEESIYNDSFRIGPAKKELAKLRNEIPEKKAFKRIMQETERFPSSVTSPEVFIVNNANKTSQQIAEAFIHPALISVEHIKPYSKGGESSAKNYIAASTRMNNIRSSTPLHEFIRRFPNIPTCTQRYIDDITLKINRGGLRNLAVAMPEVKEGLNKQSKGLINVDISNISNDVTQGANKLRTKIDELVNYFHH